jgi:hypothetical protein
LTKQLESAESILKIADMKFKNGGTTQADVYLAKAQCLDVKIKLLREGGRPEPRTKQDGKEGDVQDVGSVSE